MYKVATLGAAYRQSRHAASWAAAPAPRAARGCCTADERDELAAASNNLSGIWMPSVSFNHLVGKRSRPRVFHERHDRPHRARIAVGRSDRRQPLPPQYLRRFEKPRGNEALGKIAPVRLQRARCLPLILCRKARRQVAAGQIFKLGKAGLEQMSESSTRYQS